MYVFNGKYKNEFFFYRRIRYVPPVIPKHLSPQAVDLISKLLQKDSKKRLGAGNNGAEDIKKHPFFAVSFSTKSVTILTPWHRNPQVHHRFHNSPPPAPVLSQLNPLHTPSQSTQDPF
jgi:serine/threonine protein kinase